MRTASLAAAWCSLLKKAFFAVAWCSSRHPFFKDAELGARIAAEGCKSHFFENIFSFLSLFWALVFQLANVADS